MIDDGLSYMLLHILRKIRKLILLKKFSISKEQQILLKPPKESMLICTLADLHFELQHWKKALKYDDFDILLTLHRLYLEAGDLETTNTTVPSFYSGDVGNRMIICLKALGGNIYINIDMLT